MVRDQRRLAAIVSADVAGYSRLMGQDDSGTLAALKAHRRELIDPKITEFGGRIVKTTGDGLLLEFPSVVDAVRCAVDLQRGMAERNAGVPPNQRIDFRVGINVGDIIIDDNDIYGDGVNVAARLQTLADPGEIYVSKVVRDQVLDKLNFSFEDLGAQNVKNIARPVEAFRVELGTGASPTPSSLKSRWKRLLRSPRATWKGVGVVLVGLIGIAYWTSTHLFNAAPGHQSEANAVAVLPFAAPDGLLEEQQLADAITRNLTSMLGRGARLTSVVPQDLTARYKGKAIDVRSVGRDFGAPYLVEGEVRRVGERMEVNVQLLETTAATQIWSERFEVDKVGQQNDPNKLIVVLDDRIGRSIFTANMRRFAGPPTAKAGPIELTMHAWAVWSRDNNTVRGAREARKWFDQALSVDPNFVPAIIGKFRTLYYELDFEPNVDKKRVLKEMDELSFLAVNVDSTYAAAWASRASSLIRGGRWDAALEAIAKAEKLSSPNWGSALRSEIMVFTGKPEEALALADRARAMDPTDKEEMGWIMLQRCRAFMALGRYDEAIDSCERNIALDNWWLPHLYLVAGYALKGETAKAIAEKTTLLELRPTASIADYKRYSYAGNLEFETHLLAGLRQAGLPEQ